MKCENCLNDYGNEFFRCVECLQYYCKSNCWNINYDDYCTECRILCVSCGNLLNNKSHKILTTKNKIGEIKQRIFCADFEDVEENDQCSNWFLTCGSTILDQEQFIELEL